MGTNWPPCATCHGEGILWMPRDGMGWRSDTCAACEGSGSTDPHEHVVAKNQRLFDPAKPRRDPVVAKCIVTLSFLNRLDECAAESLRDAIRAAVIEGDYRHADDEDDSGSPIVTSTLESWRLDGVTLTRADAVALLGWQEVEDIETAAYERSRGENADARHDERMTEVA